MESTISAAAGLPRAFRFYSFDTEKSVDIAPAPSDLRGTIYVSSDRTRLAYDTQAKGQDLVQLELNH